MGTTAWPDRIVAVAVCSLAVVCLGLTAWTVVNRRAAAEGEQLAAGSVVSAIEGVTVEGAPVTVPSASCRLVRYSSSSCRFSREDEAAFAELEGAARQVGCGVIVIAPSKSEYSCGRSANTCVHSHLAQLTLRSARELRLEATPTTFVLHDRTVRWLRKGTMLDRDRSDAKMLLRALGANLRSTTAPLGPWARASF